MGRATHGMTMWRRIKLEHQVCTCNPPRFTNLLRTTRTAWHVSVATASRHQSSGYYLCQSQRCDRQMLSMTDIRECMGFCLCPYSNQALIFSALTQPAECCQHMLWYPCSVHCIFCCYSILQYYFYCFRNMQTKLCRMQMFCIPAGHFPKCTVDRREHCVENSIPNCISILKGIFFSLI